MASKVWLKPLARFPDPFFFFPPILWVPVVNRQVRDWFPNRRHSPQSTGITNNTVQCKKALHVYETQNPDSTWPYREFRMVVSCTLLYYHSMQNVDKYKPFASRPKNVTNSWDKRSCNRPFYELNISGDIRTVKVSYVIYRCVFSLFFFLPIVDRLHPCLSVEEWVALDRSRWRYYMVHADFQNWVRSWLFRPGRRCWMFLTNKDIIAFSLTLIFKRDRNKRVQVSRLCLMKSSFFGRHSYVMGRPFRLLNHRTIDMSVWCWMAPTFWPLISYIHC